MTDYHQEVLGQLRAEADNAHVPLPPKSLDTLGGLITDFMPMRSIQCEFPASKGNAGLDGRISLGQMAASAESVVSLLAYHLSGNPCAAVSFTIHHLRAGELDDDRLAVEAKLLHRTKSLVSIDFKVWSGAGRALANGSATLTVSKSPTGR